MTGARGRRGSWLLAGLLTLLPACAETTANPSTPADAGASDTGASSDGTTPNPDLAMKALPDLWVPPPPPPLQVQFLGVAGFQIDVGPDSVMTAPLYTHPSMLTVTLGTAESDGPLVESSLPPGALTRTSAVIAGHAHYDHLLDVPAVLERAPQARLFSNLTAQHLLAALAPDQPQRCNGSPPPPAIIERDRVVALDDPLASHVDYQQCPDQRPDGAPLVGSWVRVPGAHVRLMAICSTHPDQIGPIHFAPGSVDTDQCELPPKMPDWLEGATLAFLIDFLDPVTDQPRYRVYYQDAPTSVPIGIAPQDVLAEKAIDLALLCVGNYDRVVDAPQQTIAALAPRYALGGHWEDFFRSASDPPQPLPFTDVQLWTDLAQGAMPPSGAIAPMLRNGNPDPQRALLPAPGDRFEITP